MLRAIEARAPRFRNTAVMQLWFDAWNADNERAREAYDELMAELEAKASIVAQSKSFPRMCNDGLHPLQGKDDVFGPRDRCRRCRNMRDRDRRRGRLRGPGRVATWRKIAPDQEAEIIRLYTEELLDLKRIGQRFALSHVGVRKILIRNNTQLRTLSEAAKLRWKNKDV